MNNAQLYTLKVIALTKGSEEKITLPAFSEWDGSDDCRETLCKEINGLDEALRKKISITESLTKITPEKNISDLLNNIYNINEVCVTDKLPVEYLWVSGKLLLKSDGMLEKAVKERLPGIAEVLNLQSDLNSDYGKKPISEQNRGDVEEYLRRLTRAAAYNILTSTDNSDSEKSNNRNIANEFLQNADDSKRRNVREGSSINNDFEVKVDGNTIELTYSEAGFSLWDFYCIVCRGSSSNIGIAGNTGHFGTGFKSIYTLCSCVTIESSGVKCTLKPISKLKDIPCSKGDNFIKACISALAFGDNDNIIKRSRKSPIPEFKMISPSDGYTTITLQFDNAKYKEDFLDAVYNPANYVFLKNLECPKGSLKGNRYNGDYIELFFRENAPDSQESHPLYCNLPMDKCNLCFPFYVNIPKINPTETRDNYVSNDPVNSALFVNIFGTEGEFYRLFEQFANDCDKAYKYFPYNLYDTSLKDCLKKVRFLPCGNNNDNLCSIADIEEGRVYLFTERLYNAALSNNRSPVAASEEIRYVSGEAALFLLKKLNLTPVNTVLDKLDKPEKLPDDKFSEALPYNRLKLYHDNVTADDKLIEVLLKLVGPQQLVNFWDELGRCKPEKVSELFYNGKVVFLTTTFRYAVGKQGEKYYMDSVSKIQSERVIATPIFLPEPDIKDEVRNSEFLLNEETDLVKAAVRAYKPLPEIWEQFGTVHDTREQQSRMKELYGLFVELMKEHQGTFIWKSGFEKYLDSSFFDCETNAVFEFESDAVRYSAEKNLELFHLYMNTVAQEKRQEISKEYSIFANDPTEVGNEACEIRFMRIQKSVTGFVKGKTEGKECIVLLFGEGKDKEALYKFLKAQCKCDTFALARKYDKMVTTPIDFAFGFGGDNELETATPERITEIVNCAANDIRNSGMLKDNDLLLTRLITTYNLICGEKWLEFQGYGRYKKHSPVCPVCGSILFIEADAVRLGRILAGGEKRVEFPLLMCGNCYSALNYIKETKLEYLAADDTYAVVTEAAFEDLDYFFRKARFRLHLTFANISNDGKHITKTVKLKMSFLHKVLLYVILVTNAGQ